MRRSLSGAVAAALLAIAARAQGAGFELYEQGPAAIGMNGAFTAKADDASAIFYNPAGIALYDGGSVMLGASYATQGFSLRTADAQPVSASSTSGQFVLPTVYASSHIGKYVALGVGLFTQFGAGVTWNPGTQNGMTVPFPGRFLGQSISLQTVTINPTIAFHPIDQLAVGIGIDILRGSVDLTRSVQFADQEGTARLGGAGGAVGFNIGVLAVLIPKRLSVGLSYRSGVSPDFNLNVHFTGAPPELKDNVYDQKGMTTLNLPHNLTGGVAVHPTSHFTLTTDVHYSLWSDFKDLVVTFPEGKTPGFTAHQGWQDAWSVRLGGEYLIAGFALRLGLGYEVGAIPAAEFQPTTPVNDKILVSAGIGYKYKGFGVDAAYLAGIQREFTSTNTDLPATYGASTGHLVNIAFSYEWGRADECGHCGDCKGKKCCHGKSEDRSN